MTTPLLIPGVTFERFGTPEPVPVTAWEFEFRGIVFGGDDELLGLETVTGLDGLPIRTDIVPRGADHGASVFAAFLPERHVVAVGEVFGISTAERAARIELLDTMTTPALPGAAPEPLSFTLGSGVEKFVNVYPEKGPEIVVSKPYAKGDIAWAAGWVAPDPRIYSNELHVATVAPADPSMGGVVFPIVFPIVFPSGPSGRLVCTNAGRFETRPLVSIAGPITNPTIVSLTTGLRLVVDITLGSADHLAIDFLARTIVLNDSASRYTDLDPASNWFGLVPGPNVLQFLGSSTGKSTSAVISWRDAWLIAT